MAKIVICVFHITVGFVDVVEVEVEVVDDKISPYVSLSVCYASAKYIIHSLSQISIRWSSQPYRNYA